MLMLVRSAGVRRKKAPPCTTAGEGLEAIDGVLQGIPISRAYALLVNGSAELVTSIEATDRLVTAVSVVFAASYLLQIVV
jgi:hypothetical protein